MTPDPSGADHPFLYARILTTETRREASRKLRLFDEEWWLDAGSRVDARLEFTVSTPIVEGRALPFDWQDYYVLAKELSEREEEAALRSAISRAYYAAFCSAQIKVMQRAPDLIGEEGQGSHEVVWRWFRRQSNRSLAEIGVWGLRLRDDRVSADYRADAKIDSAWARDALDDAG